MAEAPPFGSYPYFISANQKKQVKIFRMQKSTDTELKMGRKNVSIEKKMT
jgi:hypothetical protein